ncbi:TetR/AcrR family transcriptional regulator [Yinghuangia seranimata]|uniref:TetR/AcrR family transcriptional regulator n=1 Tax=Yinghuangia seranimata TaxID=408067 RepID=UPI00248B1AED|nr:TetR/AcrR family transcriptional regulator [Yinghuangia seranimata]MDI2130115.1 TetR/AcrR family transcriptional regulator [Yinghuangia seranimata]
MADSKITGGAGRRIRGLDAEQRRLRRRDDLLDAALALFAEQGYHETSIEQICKRAFVGTKSFYEVFDGKEAAYLALQERIVADVTGRLAETLDEAGDTGEDDASRRLVRLFAHAFVDDIRVAKVTFGEGRAITPLAERLRRANRRWAASFVESVWARFGVRSAGDLHGVAIGVIGGLFDIIADWLLDTVDTADPAERTRLEESLLRFYSAVRAGIAAP